LRSSPVSETPPGTGHDIVVARQVPGSADEIFDFLSDLGNHWLLADRFIEVLRLDREPGGEVHGGKVRMRGPLGIRRTAVTRVIDQERATMMSGTAELAGGTRARVTWSFGSNGDVTLVRLSTDVERAGALDRLLLALGGRAWLRRRFAAILDTLANYFADRRR
jgi:hypothetical protein